MEKPRKENLTVIEGNLKESPPNEMEHRLDLVKGYAKLLYHHWKHNKPI